MRTPRLPPEFVTWSVSDGYVLHGRRWPPAGRDFRGAALYLHGIQSHGQWFEWSASLLAECGYVVLLPDRRGSGLNEPARGDTPAAQRWLNDLDEIADAARRESGAPHLAVVGVSWGGKLAAAWALRRPERVQRLLLIAPGLFPAVDVGVLGRLRIGASLLMQPAHTFPIPLNDPALFTDNPLARDFIARDPRKLTHATVRFFYESSRLDRWLIRAGTAALRPDTTLLLAGRDRIIRNTPTARWLERVALRRPNVRILPGAAHTLEFEPDGTEFQRRIEEWAHR